MPDALATCGTCGAVVDTESGSDVCPACGSSVLADGSTRGSRGTPAPDAVSAPPLPPGAPELRVDQMLVNGRFTLVRRLGRGGMGEVWLATDANLRTHAGYVALKFLTAHFRQNPHAMDLLREELEASRQLSHDNILRIHDLHTPPGEPPFILMEYIEGKTLQQIMRNRTGGRFDWEELKPLVTQLCAALQYAHSKRVIHRDLKPGNLLVDESLRLKLADFGLARLAPLAAPSDVLTRVAGTPGFMSPQQMRGQPPSVADDVYAVGATLYELLTGTCPLSRGEDFAARLETEVPERISARLAALAVDATVPGNVEDAVAACLDPDPSRRPPTVASLARRLRLVTATPEEKRAAPPPKPVVRPEEWELPPPPGPRNWSARLWGAILLAGLGAVAWMYLGPGVWPRPSSNRPSQPPAPADREPRPPTETRSPDPAVTSTPLPATGLFVRLHPRWPWPVAEVRFHGTTHGTQIVHRATSSEPNAQCLAVAPGPYVIEAGIPQTIPSSTNWINLRTNLEPARACEVTLDYAPPKSWQFVIRDREPGFAADSSIQERLTLRVRDHWGSIVPVSGPFRTTSGPYWATKAELRLGEYHLDIALPYRDLVQTNVTFDPATYRLEQRPEFATGAPVREPVAGLSWTNSLGQVLVWVDGFWAATTETRTTEFARFAQAAGLAPVPMVSVTLEGWKTLDRTWAQPGPGFDISVNAPVVGVSWLEAQAFCKWLSDQEHAAQRLAPHQEYRLPDDAQWGTLALERERGHPFPWGTDFPPPSGDGNYAGKEVRIADYDPDWPVLDENLYADPYSRTAPVLSGQTNRYGLYHVGGNVAEWCDELYQARLNDDAILADHPDLKEDGGGEIYRVVRGGSWYEGSRNPYDLRSAVRRFALPSARSDRVGFRVVLVDHQKGRAP